MKLPMTLTQVFSQHSINIKLAWESNILDQIESHGSISKLSDEHKWLLFLCCLDLNFSKTSVSLFYLTMVKLFIQVNRE